MGRKNIPFRGNSMCLQKWKAVVEEGWEVGLQRVAGDPPPWGGEPQGLKKVGQAAVRGVTTQRREAVAQGRGESCL